MRKMPQLKRIIQKIKVDKDGNVDIYLRLFSDLSLDEAVLIHHYETIRPVRQRRRPQCFRPPPLNPIEPQQTAPNAVPPSGWGYCRSPIDTLPKGYRDNRKDNAKTLRTRYTIDLGRRTSEPAQHRAQASAPSSRSPTPSKPHTSATPFAGIRRHPIYGCEDVRLECFERIERLKRIEPRRKTTSPSRERRSSRRSGRSFFRTTRFHLLRRCRFEFSADHLDSDR